MQKAALLRHLRGCCTLGPVIRPDRCHARLTCLKWIPDHLVTTRRDSHGATWFFTFALQRGRLYGQFARLCANDVYVFCGSQGPVVAGPFCIRWLLLVVPFVDWTQTICSFEEFRAGAKSVMMVVCFWCHSKKGRSWKARAYLPQSMPLQPRHCASCWAFGSLLFSPRPSGCYIAAAFTPLDRAFIETPSLKLYFYLFY